MSSVQSAFSQVPAREKYFVVTSAVSNSAATVNAGSVLEYSMTVSEFAAATAPATPAAAGSLYRDLGKTVTVYDPATNLTVQKFVAAQLVSGPASEGVAATPVTVYLRVFAADTASKVGVARVG